jgi:hypothetical protein
MTVGEKEYAGRKALEHFDKWNDITGYPEKLSSYYYEITSIITDAVDIGAKVALGLPIDLSDYGDDGICKDKELIPDAKTMSIEFVTWTMTGDCEYQATDEDSWEHGYSDETISTDELYEIFLKYRAKYYELINKI